MKKHLILMISFGVVSFLGPLHGYGSTVQDLKGASQSATVVSVKKVDTAANYVYEIGFQIDCTIYVARYKSAYDYVPPAALAPKTSVNVRLENHWLRVFLPPDRNLEMRLVSTNGMSDAACAKNAAATSRETIPAGTILPVSLDSAIGSDQSQAGAPIAATLMQDVSLKTGVTLRKGSKVFGHVVEAVRPGQGADEARLSFEFDHVQLGHQTVAITTNLRALASAMEVSATSTPKSSSDDPSTWTLTQIGGDQVAYGQGGPVVADSQVVGTYTNQGTLAYLNPDLGTECRSTMNGNTRPQAFWVFSVHACGAYGMGDVKILHSGRTEPEGQVILISDGKLVRVGKNTGMLLRVDSSAHEEESAETAIRSQIPAK